MDYFDFILHLRLRARLAKPDAEGAADATLKTIAELIGIESAHRLAAHLPTEIGLRLEAGGSGAAEHLSFGEFCQRVAIREGTNVPDAIEHARCVIETIEDAVSAHCRDVLAMLRFELAPLFYVRSAARSN